MMDLQERKKYIGGSEIAAAMGLSRWSTPLKLWSEKTGKVDPEDLSEKEYVELGSELEDFIAKKFERKTGLKVRRAPKRYEYPNYPFMSCQVDRLVTNTNELLECKNCSSWKEKEWEGEEIPIEYILQVQWQLMITGRSVGWIAVLIGGNKFVYKKVERDVELFESMRNGAIAFWDMVENQTPPVATDKDNNFIVNLYPTGSDYIKESSQDVVNAVELLQQTKSMIIDMEKTKKELEAKLKAVIGEAGGINTPEYLIKWINVKGSTFTVTRKDSRMLKVIKKKENRNDPDR